MKDYSDYLSGLIPREDFNDYEDLLDPSFYLPDFNPETDRISLLSGLHMLELMKNGILTAESRSFSAISKHQ
jgi:hypothetical protein